MNARSQFQQFGSFFASKQPDEDELLSSIETEQVQEDGTKLYPRVQHSTKQQEKHFRLTLNQFRNQTMKKSLQKKNLKLSRKNGFLLSSNTVSIV